MTVRRVLRGPLAGPDVRVADVLEGEGQDLLLAVAQGRQCDVGVLGDAPQRAARGIGLAEHVGDLGTVDGLAGRHLVGVPVSRVVEAQLQLARSDRVGEVRRHGRLPACRRLPGPGLELRQHGPVRCGVGLLQPADDGRLGLGRRAGAVRVEASLAVLGDEAHEAVVQRQLDVPVVGVQIGRHVRDGDGLDGLALVAGGDDEGARQLRASDSSLGLEGGAEVVQHPVTDRPPVGDPVDGAPRPVPGGHVRVGLGCGQRRSCRRSRQHAQRGGDEEDPGVASARHGRI